MTGRTGCGVAIPHPNGSKGLTQCGLGYGKPWLNPTPWNPEGTQKVALCPKCRA